MAWTVVQSLCPVSPHSSSLDVLCLHHSLCSSAFLSNCTLSPKGWRWGVTKPRTRGGELSPGISNSVCSYPHLFDGSLSQFSNILALLSSFCWTKYSLMPYFSLVCDCSLKTCKSNQYSCLEHPMGKGAWQAAVPGITKSWTLLSNFTF